MKKIGFLFTMLFFIQIGLGQDRAFVGSWYWSDSTNAISLFLRKDGEVSMHNGSKDNNIILEKDLKKGRYSLKGNILTITWPTSNVERSRIQFIDENTIQINRIDQKNHKLERKIIFRKVVSQELTEEKIQ